MAGMKQIKNKIKSVSNIKKMTKALEVVSTIKLQKVKKQTEQYRDFLIEFLKIAQIVHTKVDLFGWSLQTKDEGKTLLLVLSTEKWLCWSINTRLFKNIYQNYKQKKETTDVFCVGKKAVDFFWRMDFSLVGKVSVKDSFTSDDLTVFHAFLQQEMEKKTYTSIKLCFNYFFNPINQLPVQLQLLPFDKEWVDAFIRQIGNISIENYLTNAPIHKDLVLEPTAESLRTQFMEQFIGHLVYGAILQNKAGEFAARMIAMKNAKDNAGSLIDRLTLIYNKARQGAITQEISEIVSAKIALEG